MCNSSTSCGPTPEPASGKVSARCDLAGGQVFARCDLASGGAEPADGQAGGLASCPAPGGALHSMREAHPSETNQHDTQIDPWAADAEGRPGCWGSGLERAAHGRGLALRDKIALALASVPNAPWQSRVHRLVGCCANPCAGITTAGSVGVVWFRCRDRLCPTCARARSRQVEKRVAAAVRAADSLRFLTLTLRSTTAPLADEVRRLYDAFRAMRRLAEWKAHVTGGVAVLEITRNEKTGQWHPHLHVLVDGKFWHQSRISQAWLQVTGDSQVVDIRAVRSRREAGRYIAKYAAKPADLAAWPMHAIAEFAAAIHRRRMVLTFGTMHGQVVDGDEEPERHQVDRAHVPLAVLEMRCSNGCGLARRVLSAIAAQSASYAHALAVRSGSIPLHVPRATAHDLARARAAMAALHRQWQRCPAGFELGRRWHRPRPTPPPPPRDRRPNASSTPGLSDWHERPGRRW